MAVGDAARPAIFLGLAADMLGLHVVGRAARSSACPMSTIELAGGAQKDSVDLPHMVPWVMQRCGRLIVDGRRVFLLMCRVSCFVFTTARAS